MNRILVLRRHTLNIPLILLITLFFFNSAFAGDTVFQEKLGLIKAKNLKHYKFSGKSDLADRIKTAPDFVLAYWSKQDDRSYTAYNLSEDDLRLTRQCLALLPGTYKTILKERLIGIYFVEDFLGSGLADYVVDENDRIYTILMFNPAVLKKDLSELVTEKERTCFIPDRPGTSISITLDDTLPGLIYILLHEATHIVDYINRYTPYVEPDMIKIQGKNVNQTAFTDGVWSDYNRFKDTMDFKYKDRVTFYGMNQGPKINISNADDVYRALEAVPVASIYSTFNWAEDFAEYMTFYYLTRRLKTDYTITVSANDKVLYQYQPFAKKQVVDRAGQLPSLLRQGSDPE